eukprot:1134257-Prorocentrum_minimum.AAC.6
MHIQRLGRRRRAAHEGICRAIRYPNLVHPIQLRALGSGEHSAHVRGVLPDGGARGDAAGLLWVRQLPGANYLLRPSLSLRARLLVEAPGAPLKHDDPRGLMRPPLLGRFKVVGARAAVVAHRVRILGQIELNLGECGGVAHVARSRVVDHAVRFAVPIAPVVIIVVPPAEPHAPHVRQNEEQHHTYDRNAQHENYAEVRSLRRRTRAVLAAPNDL